MVLENDTRGWIMTASSGIACIIGSSIICVDLIVRLFPGKKNFRIQDSNVFLSSSLSLSFGVMLFSSLYSMLPSAKSSLIKGGFSPKAASWTLIVLFLAGVIGIQVLSRVMHHYMPSHVVDCDHTHDEEAQKDMADDHHDHEHGFDKRNVLEGNGSKFLDPPRWRSRSLHSRSSTNPRGTPRRLLSEPFSSTNGSEIDHDERTVRRRPSLHTQISSKMANLVSTRKSMCDEDGQCYGYTDPCGNECFKIAHARGYKAPHAGQPRQPGLPRTVSAPHAHIPLLGDRHPTLENVDENAPLLPVRTDSEHLEHDQPSSSPDRLHAQNGSADYFSIRKSASNGSLESSSSHPPFSPGFHHQEHDHDLDYEHDHAHQPSHHHHVPSNAFLSIGLQTSIAIALHKLPEGFITYATNHANPNLGFSVFLALFIHNITEGFAMALPLYLAINSRWKAMFWSSILGGVSQPLGAGIAALWFRIARGSEGPGGEPGEGVYGGMFAVVAGIMASVALQLFSESMDLTHNRNLCMAFAFVGMGILGISSALTA